MRRGASRLLLATLSLGLLAGSLGAPAQAEGTPVGEEFTSATPPQTPGLPDLDALDPVRFSYDDAIVEHYQVPTRLNPATCDPATIATCPHTIWIDVIRPDTTEKVPAIMMPSPYYNTLGRGFREQCKTPHQSPPGGLPGSPGAPALSDCDENQTAFPEWYDEYFVPRGYAYVAMDLHGTRNSAGCQTYGDEDEVLTAIDVIDFLAEQEWSNGKVGMTGGSYDGTIATGAAARAAEHAEHPEALAAIIPIRAIDAWYDYHWFNGVMSSQHTATPALFTAALAAADLPNSGTDDPLYAVHLAERKVCIATMGALTDLQYAQTYSDADEPFWAERDFHRDAGAITAATFIIHGLYDFNVKPHNAGWLWDALPDALPKKLWFLDTDHTDPRCFSEEACQASGHTWTAPKADLFVESNHRWWLQFLKGVEAGALATPVEVQDTETGAMKPSTQWPLPGTPQVYSFASDGRLVPGPSVDEAGSAAWADGPAGQGAPSSISFETPPFATATRLSGQIGFDLKLSTSGIDTTIAARIEVPDATGTDRTISYGWMRPYYRGSVTSGPERPVPGNGSPMPPGQLQDVSFASMHLDYVVPAGGVVRITFNNNAGNVQPLHNGGVVTLATGADGSTLRLPVAAAAGPVAPPPPAPRPPAPRPPAPAPLPATGGSLTLALAAAAVLAAGLAAARRARQQG